MKYLRDSIYLIGIMIVMVCGIYPLMLWCVGQILFPFQANGSVLKSPAGQIIGSQLIAQPFTLDHYFHPRPSANAYNAAYSKSSALAPSNYFLRSRIAGDIAREVKFSDGNKVGPAIDAWFQANRFAGQAGIVKQWAHMNDSLAQAWVESSPEHVQFVQNWVKNHPVVLRKFAKSHPALTPRLRDLAVGFFESFSDLHPGKFPAINGELISSGPEIQGRFFEMWRTDNKEVILQNLPADMLTTSASGLDPHITLINAQVQLERVAKAIAQIVQRDITEVHDEVAQIMQDKTLAPFGGLAGDALVNVLELNLELKKRYEL